MTFDQNMDCKSSTFETLMATIKRSFLYMYEKYHTL